MRDTSLGQDKYEKENMEVHNDLVYSVFLAKLHLQQTFRNTSLIFDCFNLATQTYIAPAISYLRRTHTLRLEIIKGQSGDL